MMVRGTPGARAARAGGRRSARGPVEGEKTLTEWGGGAHLPTSLSQRGDFRNPAVSHSKLGKGLEQTFLHRGLAGGSSTGRDAQHCVWSGKCNQTPSPPPDPGMLRKRGPGSLEALAPGPQSSTHCPACPEGASEAEWEPQRTTHQGREAAAPPSRGQAALQQAPLGGARHGLCVAGAKPRNAQKRPRHADRCCGPGKLRGAAGGGCAALQMRREPRAAPLHRRDHGAGRRASRKWLLPDSTAHQGGGRPPLGDSQRLCTTPAQRPGPAPGLQTVQGRRPRGARGSKGQGWAGPGACGPGPPPLGLGSHTGGEEGPRGRRSWNTHPRVKNGRTSPVKPGRIQA